MITSRSLKQRSSKGVLRAAVLAAPAVLALAGFARGATLYFDADANATGNVTDGTNIGGSGNWDPTVTANWWDGVSAADQAWADGNDAIIYSTGTNVTLTGNIAAGTVTKRGAGNLGFLHNGVTGNTWTGKLVVEAGRFQTDETGLPTCASPTPDAVTLVNNAAVWANQAGGDHDATTGANVGLTVGTGGGTVVGGGLLRFDTSWGGTVSGSGNLDVIFGTLWIKGSMAGYSGAISANRGGNGQGRIFIDGALSSTMTFASSLVASASDSTFGAGGTIIINSSNFGLSRAWTIPSSAVIGLTAPAALGNSGNAITMNGATGTTLGPAQIGGVGGLAIPYPITITGVGDTNAGGGNYMQTFSCMDTGLVTFSGAITGAGTFVKGNSFGANGTVVLTNTANSWTGGTAIGGGRLLLGNNEVLPDSTVLRVVAGGKTLDLGGFTETIGAMAVNSAGFIDFSGGTLRIGSGDLSGTWSGNSLAGNGGMRGAGTLVKIGAGNLRFNDGTKNQSYTGGVVIQAGSVSVRDNRFQLGDDSATNSLTLDGGKLIMENGAFTSGADGAMQRPVIITANGGSMDFGNNGETFASSFQGSGTLTTMGTAGASLNLNQTTNPRTGGSTIWTGNIVLGANTQVSAGIGGSNGWLPGYDPIAYAGNPPTVPVISGSGTVKLNHSGGSANRNAVELAGTVNLLVAGTQEETMVGNSTSTGTTTINAGSKLRIGWGGAANQGALGATAVANAGQLTFFRDNNSTFPGSISGAGAIIKQGTGVLVMQGAVANTFSGLMDIQGGEVDLDRAATAISGSVKVGPSSSLKLIQANQIADAAPMELAGGMFNANAQSDVVGTLLLTDNSGIDMGAPGSILQFADSSAQAWTAGKALTITNWAGTPFAGGGTDQVKFDSSSAALTAGQVAQVSFLNPVGLPAGTYPAVWAASNPGELVPLPEPSIALLGLGSLALLRRRRA